MAKRNILYVIALVLIFLTGGAAQAVTKTWDGAPGTGLDWTLPANWSDDIAPIAGDDIVFNTPGTYDFSTLPASVAYNSISVLQGNVTFAGSTPMVFTLGGSTGNDLVIAGGASLILGTNANITLAAAATADISGTLTNNGTYDAGTTTAVTTVAGTGTFINSTGGTISNSSLTRLRFNAGGTYRHNQDGGSIPTATWDVTSNCIISGMKITEPAYTTFNQTFGNFTWDCPDQTIIISLYGYLRTVRGNFTVTETNTGMLILGGAHAGDLTIDGNYSQTGGSFSMSRGIYMRTMTVKGNFFLIGGTFSTSFDQAGFNTMGTVIVTGNFSHTGGTITETTTEMPGGTIIFNGTGTQTYTSGGTISNTISFIVNGGATLQMGTGASPSVISGSDGTFELLPGATLGVTSPEGIDITGATGNIQVSGTRTYNAGANYIYNGTSAQVTGLGLAQNTPANVTIENSAGVTLSSATTINRLLTMNSGTLNMGSFDLTAGSLTGSSNITGTSGTLTLTVGSDGTTPAAYSGVISNGSATSVGLTKTGTGTMILSGANTYTGATTITGGTLQFGAESCIGSSSGIVLNGGTLNTGATTGYNVTAGTLDVQSNSTIDFGSGSHSLIFNASNAVTWTTGATLTINGWTGSVGVGGSNGKIFVGLDNNGLTPAQLDNINFYGFANGAGMSETTGEVYPNAVPAIEIGSGNPAVAAGNITFNTSNNIIYIFSNTVTGGNALLSGLQITTAGNYANADVSNIKAWYSTDNVLDPATDVLLSTIGTPGVAGTKVFLNLPDQVIPVGITYIIITADVPCAATAGNAIYVNAITTSDETFTYGTKTGTASNGGVQTFVTAPYDNVSDPVATIDDAQSLLTWTSPIGCYDEIMIVGKAGSAVVSIPTGNGSSYSPNLAFGSGSGFDGGYVLYKGATSSQIVTALTNGNTYYYTFFTRKGILWSDGVTVSAVPTADGERSYRSSGNGNWSNPQTWENSDGTLWTIASTAPDFNNGQITILAGHTVTVSSNVTVDQVTVQGQVSVSSGTTLTINTGAEAVDFSVNGTLYNSGTVTATGVLAFNSGSAYEHARDGGSIPTATWDVSSNCNIIGVTVTEPTPSTFNQTFGNFTWNSAGQTASISLSGNLRTVMGNLSVTGTGSGYFVLGGGSAGNLTIEGNYIQTGGSFAITGGSNPRTMTVRGNFSLSNGTFSTSYDFGAGSAPGTLNVAGNFSHTGGTITETSGSSPGGTIVFNGTGTQNYTSGGTVNYAISFTVNSGSTLQMAAAGTTITGAGIFTLSAGATLGITSPDGITALGSALGNIQTTVGRAYNTGANYIYNGTSNQTEGNGLPVTVNNLTIANTGSAGNNIVTLSGAETITANLSIATGVLSLPAATTSSAATLTLGGAGTASGSWGSTGSGAINKNDLYFLSTSSGVVNIGSSTLTPGTWFGGTSQDWNTDTNWYGTAVPLSSTDVVIPLYAANQPEIANGVTALCADLTVGDGASLTINEGGALTVGGDLSNSGTLTIESILTGTDLTPSGSLIVTGASTGNITYNRQLKLWSDATYDSFDWHYFSTPVASDVAPADNPANAGKITAVWLWNEAYLTATVDDWVETTSALTSGIGYNLDQTATSNGMISFTGTIVKNTTVTATSPYDTPGTIDDNQAAYEARWINFPSRSNYGGGGFNLLGNPFTSALRVTDEDADISNDFLTVNYSSFDPIYAAVYVYDGSQDLHGVYNSIGLSTLGDGEKYIQSCQGFFVLAGMNNVTFSFDTEMQGHSVTTPMVKKSEIKATAWPSLQLKATYGAAKVSTTSIVFNTAMTIGLDPGYDIGLISAQPAVEIYTHLVKDNGVNFTRQALPIPGSDGYIVAVGMDSEAGGEVIFSGVIVPLEGFKFILEDRVTGKLTDLSTATYTVTIPAKTYGIGRFYVHITDGTQTAIDPVDPEQSNVRIWATGSKVIIKGAVGEKATAEVYDTQGRKVYDNILTDASFNSFELSSASKGVYIVVVKDGVKVYRQKVVML